MKREGSEAGSGFVPLTNGSRRLKNMRIQEVFRYSLVTQNVTVHFEHLYKRGVMKASFRVGITKAGVKTVALIPSSVRTIIWKVFLSLQTSQGKYHQFSETVRENVVLFLPPVQSEKVSALQLRK
jgi:hypothetical protein